MSSTLLAHAATARLLLSMAAALAITGCASFRGDPAGVALGDGRAQACQRACSAIDPIAPVGSAERCEPCNCDQLAGNPAICTTTRHRIP